MSKYKLTIVEKKILDNQYKTVIVRINDQKIRNALKEAVNKSNLSSQKLVHEMIEHCLKDAGLLK